MVRCWSMTEEDSMRGVLVRAERKESKKERRRKEKRENIVDKKNFLLLFFFFWKDQKRETFAPPLIVFFCTRRKKKKSHSKPKKEERKENHNKIYSSRASRNVKAASSAEKKTLTRRIKKARSSSVLMIGFYIARLRDFYCADRTRIFSLFVVFEGREENLSSRALSLSLVWKPPSKNERKRERNENEKKLIKKNIIKNVAARALRKTSVLSFRVHHARDIFVMNRWRSSVFFIWTRMYLYITVYPPLLFCVVFFLLLLLLVFLGLLQRRFLPFRSKKEKEREELFFAFLDLSFLVLSGAFERDKKKSSLFFLLLSDANKRTNANASLRLKSTTGGRVQKDDARLKKVLFLFCCVVLCSCFWSGCCFVSRGEREGTTKKAQKRKEKILSVQKIRVPSSFFCSKKKRAAKDRKNEGGLQIFSGSCRKLFRITQL